MSDKRPKKAPKRPKICAICTNTREAGYDNLFVCMCVPTGDLKKVLDRNCPAVVVQHVSRLLPSIVTKVRQGRLPYVSVKLVAEYYAKGGRRSMYGSPRCLERLP